MPWPCSGAARCGGGFLHLLLFEEFEMPKMKTKSGAKKRFRLTAGGKVRAGVAYKRHNFSAKSPKMKRQARGTFVLNQSNARTVKRYFLPNG